MAVQEASRHLVAMFGVSLFATLSGSALVLEDWQRMGPSERLEAIDQMRLNAEAKGSAKALVTAENLSQICEGVYDSARMVREQLDESNRTNPQLQQSNRMLQATEQSCRAIEKEVGVLAEQMEELRKQFKEAAATGRLSPEVRGMTVEELLKSTGKTTGLNEGLEGRVEEVALRNLAESIAELKERLERDVEQLGTTAAGAILMFGQQSRPSIGLTSIFGFLTAVVGLTTGIFAFNTARVELRAAREQDANGQAGGEQ